MKRQVFAVTAILALGSARSAITQQPATPQPSYTALDAQYLDSTEYLIASDELRFSGEFVAIGRILALPSTTSRGRTQFLVMGPGGDWQTGDRAWTNQYYKTRPATARDIVVGKFVFCLNETENGVFRAPRTRMETLTSGWWATTITDVSTLNRGEVKAGNSRLSVSCLRVLQ